MAAIKLLQRTSCDHAHHDGSSTVDTTTRRCASERACVRRCPCANAIDESIAVFIHVRVRQSTMLALSFDEHRTQEPRGCASRDRARQLIAVTTHLAERYRNAMRTRTTDPSRS